jgi:CheY-like chemotaxis protein
VGGRVLIVDDDASVAESLSDFLDGAGYAAVTAEHGLAALELLRGGLRPCAILLDLMMPVMNGWDFRRHQLADPELRDIPVIVVTAGGFSPESLASQFGQTECMWKPLSIDVLLSKIARLCGCA